MSISEQDLPYFPENEAYWEAFRKLPAEDQSLELRSYQALLHEVEDPSMREYYLRVVERIQENSS